jgi:hypothetical protein
MFGPADRRHLQVATDAAGSSLAHIGASDALYHNVEHTVHVTLVGLEILRGKHATDLDVTRGDWLNAVISLLCHDVGYVRGICGGDDGERLSTGVGNQNTRIEIEKSDAALLPIHVNRGKRYVAEMFADNELVDVPFVHACIERTRFPVPSDDWYQQTGDYPGLVRGADLIGQLSDPRYLRKLAAIFYEFEEVGYNEEMGYRMPGDLMHAYPVFFAKNVEPFIHESITYLQLTQEGRDVIDHLYENLDEARQPETLKVAGLNSR